MCRTRCPTFILLAVQAVITFRRYVVFGARPRCPDAAKLRTSAVPSKFSAAPCLDQIPDVAIEALSRLADLSRWRGLPPPPSPPDAGQRSRRPSHDRARDGAPDSACAAVASGAASEATDESLVASVDRGIEASVAADLGRERFRVAL